MDQKLLKLAVEKNTVFLFDDYQSFLKAVYNFIKKRAAGYTRNKFSKDIGLGENTVATLIMSGRRKLTEKNAQKIAKNLGLKKSEVDYFLQLVALKNTSDSNERESLTKSTFEIRQRHTSDGPVDPRLQFFSRWYHAVIFEILGMENISKTPEGIAEVIKPQLSLVKIKESLRLLESCGVVGYDEHKNEHFRKTDQFDAGDEVPGLAIVRFHQEMINLGKDALMNASPDERDIASVTLSIPRSLLPRIKQDLTLFRKYLLFLADQYGDKEQVVQVNVQMFPISK